MKMNILIHLLGYKTKDIANLRKFTELNNITLERRSDRFFLLSFKDVPVDNQWELFKILVSSVDLNFKFIVIAVLIGNNFIRPNNFGSLFQKSNYDKMSDTLMNFAKRSTSTIANLTLTSSTSFGRIHSLTLLLKTQQKTQNT